MPIQISYAETLRQGTDKINGILGTDSGAMGSPYELTFNTYHRIRTLAVTADIEIGLDLASAVSNTFETLITTGDGVHNLTFDPDIVLSGDLVNNEKVQCIDFRYIGGVVFGVISNMADVLFPPELTSATMNGAETGTQTLDLVFDEAVTITTAGWSVSASGGAVTVSSVSSGSGTVAPKLSLSRVIQSNETLTVSYDPSTGSTVSLATSTELETVSALSVTNHAYEINLEVLFTGTSVETGKGTITNPDTGTLTVSQNGKLLFTRTTDTAVASALTNYWRTVSSYTRGTFAFVMNRDTGFTNSAAQMLYRVDANNDLAILKSASSSNVDLRIRSGGSTVYSLSTSVSSNNRFRIQYNASNEVVFEYWSGSAWTQMGTTQTVNIGSSGQLQASTNSSSSDAPSDVFSFDSIYVTDNIYPTVTP